MTKFMRLVGTSLLLLWPVAVSALLLSHSALALAADSPTFAYVTNYGDSTVSMYQLDPADGRVLPLGDAPAGSGPVSITLHPNGLFAYVVNSGDRNIWTYTLSPTGVLTPQPPAADLALPTGGFAVHPNGLFAYATSSAFLVPGGGPGTGSYHTISMYTVNPQTGNLTKTFETPTPGWSVAPGFVVVHPFLNVLYLANAVSDGTVSIYQLDANGVPQFTKWVRTGQNPSMLTIGAAGRVLYAVNRGGAGGSTVALFDITASGDLLPHTPPTVGAGLLPTAMALTPNGQFAYVANALTRDTASKGVSMFTVSANGSLTPAGTKGAGQLTQSLAVDATSQWLLAANNGSDTVSVYRIDPDGQLTRFLETVAGHQPTSIVITSVPQPSPDWTGWNELDGGGLTPSGPAAVSVNGALWIFVRGMDDRIYGNRWTANGWTGWNELDGGGLTPSGPAAVAYGNMPFVFVRGMDDRIYWNLLTANGWTGWNAEPCGGLTPSRPAAVPYGDGPLLLVRGEDDRIYWNLLTANGWTCWNAVPGDGLTTAAPAAAVFQSTLSVIVQGIDNHIYDNLFTAGDWTGWAEVAGNGLTPSGPAATVFHGELWSVVRGMDNRIYRNVLPASGPSTWTGWSEVPSGGFTLSEPGAAATASTLSLVVRGIDNRIYLNQGTIP